MAVTAPRWRAGAPARLSRASRAVRIVVLPVLLLFGLFSCRSGPADREATSAPRSTSSTSTTTVPAAAAPIAPLTGLPDPSGVVTSRPALSMKIDNAPRARPQSGLEQADLVFEEVVEGGTTRFIAVFHSKDAGEVGPIRSVRPMDPQILGPLKGLFGYSGGIPEYISLLSRSPVTDVGFDRVTAAYRADGSRPRPHNLFGSLAALWAKAEGAAVTPPDPLFPFLGTGEGFSGEPAAGLTISYSKTVSASYDYDPASTSWLRSQDGVPHVSAAGPRIDATNLVVQFVPVRLLGQVDRSGTRVSETIVVGEGEAWVLSGGKVAKGRWNKALPATPTRYLDGAGAPVKLAPGRTWIHLVPLGSPVAIR